ncbi:hypothetical protein GXP67_01185 [Rhodocytophaga rosea]|uniref:Uncharacterized protein n=2 Tax=Rhodocytophaga rosea TaxID=2704465 RepID=A0A6C0GUF0_9BACT|nr:hypothetical protein GXP67_01185 [Rhodocytophaga rosea]
MPEEDEDFLNKSGLSWETILEGSQKWLLVYNYPLPVGYNIDKADFALRIDACYPSTQIDMIYFSPHLSRRDGKIINNLTTLPIDAKTWQQWSRHRTSENPWEPGVDNVSTHIELMLYCLKQEFNKR